MEMFFYLNIFSNYYIKVLFLPKATPLPNINAVPEG